MKEKKYIAVCFLLLCALESLGGCLSEYNHAKRKFQDGYFTEARQTFQWCQSYCSNDLDQTEIARYIDLCNQKIEASRKEQAARRRQMQEQQEQSRKQVKKNKLIYLSCDAWNFEHQYPRFESSIISGMAKTGCRFTKDKDKAYWVITLTAIAKADRENDEYYYSSVDIVGSLYNTILEYDMPLFITDNAACPKGIGDYEKAAEEVYRFISDSCVSEIMEIINIK